MHKETIRLLVTIRKNWILFATQMEKFDSSFLIFLSHHLHLMIIHDKKKEHSLVVMLRKIIHELNTIDYKASDNITGAIKFVNQWKNNFIAFSQKRFLFHIRHNYINLRLKLHLASILCFYWPRSIEFGVKMCLSSMLYQLV